MYQFFAHSKQASPWCPSAQELPSGHQSAWLHAIQAGVPVLPDHVPFGQEVHVAAPDSPSVDSPAAQGVQVLAPVNPRVECPGTQASQPVSEEKDVRPDSPAGHGVHGCPANPPKPSGQFPVPAVTELTSQLEMSALKASAPENISFIFVTELTSQLERSALKAIAIANMRLISVTELTSQLEMSALNADAKKNM